MTKLTLPEYLSLYDSETRWIDDRWTEHWKKVLPTFLESNNYIHEGDCTNQCCTCPLCLLELWLVEYKKYYFDSEEDYDFKEQLVEYHTKDYKPISRMQDVVGMKFDKVLEPSRLEPLMIDDIGMICQYLQSKGIVIERTW